MRKVYPRMPDVDQSIADEATDLIHQHLDAYGVGRAADLPEEGKVALSRALAARLAAALPEDEAPRDLCATGWRASLAGLLDRIQPGRRPGYSKSSSETTRE